MNYNKFLSKSTVKSGKRQLSMTVTSTTSLRWLVRKVLLNHRTPKTEQYIMIRVYQN